MSVFNSSTIGVGTVKKVITCVIIAYFGGVVSYESANRSLFGVERWSLLAIYGNHLGAFGLYAV